LLDKVLDYPLKTALIRLSVALAHGWRAYLRFRTMIEVAYAVAATLELVGIGFVLLDVRADRRRARALIANRSSSYVPSSPGVRGQMSDWVDDEQIRRDPRQHPLTDAHP
jgi:hypothetical protein